MTTVRDLRSGTLRRGRHPGVRGRQHRQVCSECAAGAALPARGRRVPVPGRSGRRVPARRRIIHRKSPGPLTTGRLRSKTRRSSCEQLDAAAVRTSRLPSPATSPMPMEKTRELLTPVVDLITLQPEMQAALQRLAASLETFATGLIPRTRQERHRREPPRDSRARTRADPGAAARYRSPARRGRRRCRCRPPASDEPPRRRAGSGVCRRRRLAGCCRRDGEGQEPPAHLGLRPHRAATAELWNRHSGTSTKVASEPGEAARPPQPQSAESASRDPRGHPTCYSTADLEVHLATRAPLLVRPPWPRPPVPRRRTHARPGFQLPEVQAAQRYYNESPFINRIRDVRRSLGKPKANLTRLSGPNPGPSSPSAGTSSGTSTWSTCGATSPATERVALHREGMDLDELAFHLQGEERRRQRRRPTGCLRARGAAAERSLRPHHGDGRRRGDALEDATEEIWDSRRPPSSSGTTS